MKKIILLSSVILGAIFLSGCDQGQVGVPPPLPSSFCTDFIYSDWSVCSTNGTQSRTVINALPNGCNGGGPILSQNCKTGVSQDEPKDLGPKWDYVSLTPGIFNKIIQKIKSAPNGEIKVAVSGEQDSVTFYYSFVPHDPCEPLLKDFLVFEMETTTYVDENGQKYPNGPITNYYSMRDIDHDNYPEDYFTPGKPNPDAKLCDLLHLPLTKDTPDIDNLLSYWEAGMNYFAAKLLK